MPQDYYYFTFLIILLTIFVDIFLLVLIISQARKKEVKITFSIFIISIIMFLAVELMDRLAGTIEHSIMWNKISYTCGLVIANVFFVFTEIFPETSKKIHSKIIIFYALATIIISYYILFTNNLVASVDFVRFTSNTAVIGNHRFLYVYMALMIIIFLSGFINLYRKLKISTGIVRMQIKYIFWGMFLAVFFVILFNIVLPQLGVSFLNAFGPIFTLFITGFITYAIMRYKLMDVKFILHQSLLYVFTIITILVLVNILIYIFGSSLLFFSLYVICSLIAIITIALFIPIKKLFEYIAQKHFFLISYNIEKILKQMNTKLRTSIDPNEIYTFIYNALSSIFLFNKFAVAIYNEKNDSFIIKYNRGFQFNNNEEFLLLPEFKSLCVQKNDPLVIEELQMASDSNKIKVALDEMAKQYVSIIIPINIFNKNLGLIILGPKESGEMYNKKDLELLNLVGDQVAFALENAFLYSQLEERRQEIHRKNAALEEQNEHLEKLLKMRSDFLEIASHQLKTPVSVIKGLLNMEVRGQYNNDPKKKEELLKNVYNKTVTLSTIINDILDASELDSEKEFTIRLESTNIQKIIKQIVDEKQEEAYIKGLKLAVQMPNKVPNVLTTPKYFKQILENLINNAIQYTVKGSITVKVSVQKENVKISVIDTGIGIPPNDVSKIFTKFERSENAPLVYPDGTGLGLYIIKKIIQAHRDAKIYIEKTNLGEGTTFTVELPKT